VDFGKVTSAAGIPNVQIGNLAAIDGTDTAVVSNTVVSNASNSSSTPPVSEGRPASTIMILAIVIPISVVLLLGCCMLVLRAKRRHKEDATINSPSPGNWASHDPASAKGEPGCGPNAQGEPAPAVNLSSALGFADLRP
jgi:hypothetical protein